MIEEFDSLLKNKWATEEREINYDKEGNLLSYNIISKIMFGKDLLGSEEVKIYDLKQNKETVTELRTILRDSESIISDETWKPLNVLFPFLITKKISHTTWAIVSNLWNALTILQEFLKNSTDVNSVYHQLDKVYDDKKGLFWDVHTFMFGGFET